MGIIQVPYHRQAASGTALYRSKDFYLDLYFNAFALGLLYIVQSTIQFTLLNSISARLKIHDIYSFNGITQDRRYFLLYTI